MTINVVLSYPLSGSWDSIDRYLCSIGGVAVDRQRVVWI